MSEQTTVFIENDNERTLSREEVDALRAEYSIAQDQYADNGGAQFTETVEAFIRVLEQEDSPESQNILELMQYMPPQEIVNVGEHSFAVSGTKNSGGRHYAVGYVTDEFERVSSRLFYKSQSEGEWRVAPWAETDKNNSAHYLSKGEKFDAGYVRETRLHDNLRQVLNGKEATSEEWPKDSIDWLYAHFTKDVQGSRLCYDDVADRTNLRSLPDGAFRFAPGEGFMLYEEGEPSPAEQLQGLKLDESINPVFDKPTRVIESNHGILGKVTTEVYKNIFENLAWHMSHDDQGRVWVSGITSSTDKTNSYGASAEVLLGGTFDNKPLEYRSQIGGLVEGTDYVPIPGQKLYVDITPLLDNLPVIKQYRAARGINRK